LGSVSQSLSNRGVRWLGKEMARQYRRAVSTKEESAHA
jgi:hypothetical protein